MKPVEIIEFFKFFDNHACTYNEIDKIYDEYKFSFPTKISRFRFSNIWDLWESAHSLNFSYTILEMDNIRFKAPQIEIFCDSNHTWFVSTKETSLETIKDIELFIEDFDSFSIRSN